LKTQDILDLVREVLNNIPEPWPNDIIDQVCLAIERNAVWNNLYNQLKAIYGIDVLNQMIGRHTFALSGFNQSGPVRPAKSKIIKTYSWLS